MFKSSSNNDLTITLHLKSYVTSRDTRDLEAKKTNNMSKSMKIAAEQMKSMNVYIILLHNSKDYS